MNTIHFEKLLLALARSASMAALSAFSVLMGLSSAVRAQAPADPIRIERYHAPGQGSVNSWIMVGRDSVAVIDAQRAIPEATQLVAQLRQIGKPVRAIVLTHEHPDHIGGLDVLVQAFPEAEVMASAATTTFIRDNGAGMVKAMRETFGFGDRFPTRIPVPTRLLRGGESVQLAGQPWRIQQLAEGEASSMTVLSSDVAKVVLVADLAGHRMTPWMVDGHVRAWIRQLDDALVRFSGFAVYPGHGATGPSDEVLGGQKRYLVEFIEAVQREMAGSKAPLGADARKRIREWADARYPGWLRVAPPPNLIEMNADAVAKELAGP